jgi:hypothetical protein
MLSPLMFHKFIFAENTLVIEPPSKYEAFNSFKISTDIQLSSYAITNQNDENFKMIKEL